MRLARLLLWAVAGPLSLAAAPGGAQPQPERRSDTMSTVPTGGITVTREDDPVLPGQSGWLQAQCYASLQGNDLLRAALLGGKSVLVRSTDGGQTWHSPQVMGEDVPVDNGHVRTTSIATLYLDPDNGRLVCFLSEIINQTVATGFAYGDATGYGPHTMRLFYRVSRDAGHTWEPAQQLVESGSRYNRQHWARDVWYDRSALVIEGQSPHRLADGVIGLPAYLWPTADYMKQLFVAQAWPEGLRGDARYFIESRCLLMRWRPDGSGLEFTSGGPMRLPGGFTSAGTCGSDEPAVAYLDSQRWFAIVRTSTSHVAEFREKGLPLVRQCLLTEDGGATWQPGRPLLFDDGTEVQSPSAWSWFIRSSRTGKWYWIGNLIPHPCYGDCDPRYPLQIAELDPRRLCLKKATVTVIEDKAPEDDKWVRFSNFRVYEERGSGDFIVLMRKGYCELAAPDLPTPSYRYRIRVPGR
jgi:hypothetical protein